MATDITLRGGLSADIDNKISSIISEYLPDFVRNNHSGFVDFIEAYYEWMEQVENPYATSATLMDTLDIDRTLDSFIEYFKETYLYGFPMNFATGVDQKTVLKNINNFYKAKGTEAAYKFLFRILHDSDVEFFYPKVDILRTSDGKWIQDKSLKVTSNNGTNNFSMKNRTVQQYDIESGKIIAYANVESVYQYKINQYDVTELFLRNIIGTFIQGGKVKCTLSDDSVVEEIIYTIPSVINIISGGVGYRASDLVQVDEDSPLFVSGRGAIGSVSKVSETGVIQSAQIDNFGVNYETTNTDKTLPVVFRSSSGNADASGSVSLDALCIYPGYYSNNDGMVSSNKKIRDNNYYQEYSYLLKAEVSLEKYKNQIKKLVHPAGTKMFGNISIMNSVAQSSSYSTQAFQETMPVVGRFTSYTLDTHDNLRGTTASGGLVDLYPSGFYPGATASLHNLANTGGRLSIIKGGHSSDVVGGYTLGSFTAGLEILGDESGITADIFTWHRNTATGGVIFLQSNTGGIAAFDEDEMVTVSTEGVANAGGMTGIVQYIRFGNATVSEFGSLQHDENSLGLTAGATLYGATGYWDIENSFQQDGLIKQSGMGVTMEVQVFGTTTTGYTSSYDYSIGNLVLQGDVSTGNQSEGIVMEWIAGESGGTDNTLKIKHTRGDNFETGLTITEIDNYTGLEIEYIFSVNDDGAGNTAEVIRNKIKHLKLRDTVKQLRTEVFNSDG